MQGADSLPVSPLATVAQPRVLTPAAPRPLPRDRRRETRAWSIDGPDLRADVESLERWLDLNA